MQSEQKFNGMKQVIPMLSLVALAVFALSCNKDDDDDGKTPEIPVVYTPCNTVLDGWEVNVNRLPVNEKQGQNDLCFLDENIGYTVGDEGTILKTTNGGQEWVILEQAKDPVTNQYFPDAVTKADLYSVFFVDEQVGYVGGGYDFIPGTNQGSYGAVLLRTIDGGENWNIQYLTGVTQIRDIHFFDEINGLALFLLQGSNPNILDDILYKTQDGGATWKAAPPPIDEAIWGRQFDVYSDGIGVLVGDDSVKKKYFRSTDRGTTWTEAPISDGICHLMDYRTAEEGYCHCLGHIYYTTDAGLTWNNIMSEFLYNANFLHNQSPSEVFTFWPVSEQVIVDGNTTDHELKHVNVYQTIDGGKTWKNSVVDKECVLFGKEYIYSEDLFYTFNLYNVTKFKRK